MDHRLTKWGRGPLISLASVAVFVAAATVATQGTSAGTPSPGDPHGLGGFFHIQCGLARVARDDPIVHYGQPGASHLHDFYGARTITASSIPSGLLGKATTCRNPGDTAGYWTPTPTMNGFVINPQFQNEYWFDGGFKRVSPIPFGMELVAGNSTSTTLQPTSHVFYYCGQSPVNTFHSPIPYSCAKSPDTATHDIIMVVVFPQCWDGVLFRGHNDSSHLAYPVRPGVCPRGFDHPLPRLEEHVHTGIQSPFDKHGRFVFGLSSGPFYTLHGDFMNAWREAILSRFVARCINAHVACPPNVTP